MRKEIVWFALASALLLTGCNTDQVGASVKPQPICKALVGPIKYNSKDVKSPRHAGPALAPDLKQRNQVGQQLGCPSYR